MIMGFRRRCAGQAGGFSPGWIAVRDLPAATKNFPLNTEVEAMLTFAGEDPGRWVRDVTPSPESITVREHHSFVQLPPPRYKPRAYDPRSSFFGPSYMDYATPISERS